MQKPKNAVKAPRSPGRPREFDMEAALDGALQVFRERGYHAASLTELGAAMRLTAGSIYKAFSDKRAIFLAAFARYTRQRNTELQRLLAEQTDGLSKIRATLYFYAESSFGIEGRRGCLVVVSATELATFDEEVAAQVAASLQRLEQLLRDLIRQGQADGSVPMNARADATARAIVCLLQGLRVVGKLGRTREEMFTVVNEAMRLLY